MQASEYYHNLGNHFWRLLGMPNEWSYEKRLKMLKDKRIGLWDVYKEAAREGSLDSRIRTGIKNDFSYLKKYKKIKYVYFNGKTSERGGKKVIESLGYKTGLLLSSSGANNRKSKERIRQWSIIFLGN